MGTAARILVFDADGQGIAYHPEGNADYWIRDGEFIEGRVVDVPGRGPVVAAAVEIDPKLPEGVDPAADPGLVAHDGSKVVVSTIGELEASKAQARNNLSDTFVAVVEAGIPYDGKAVRLDRDAAFYAAILAYPEPWSGLRVDCVDGSRATVDDPEAFARAALEVCAEAEKLRALDPDVRRAEDAAAVAAVLGR